MRQLSRDRSTVSTRTHPTAFYQIRTQERVQALPDLIGRQMQTLLRGQTSIRSLDVLKARPRPPEQLSGAPAVGLQPPERSALWEHVPSSRSIASPSVSPPTARGEQARSADQIRIVSRAALGLVAAISPIGSEAERKPTPLAFTAVARALVLDITCPPPEAPGRCRTYPSSLAGQGPITERRGLAAVCRRTSREPAVSASIHSHGEHSHGHHPQTLLWEYEVEMSRSRRELCGHIAINGSSLAALYAP
jgi:hypothetical protein